MKTLVIIIGLATSMSSLAAPSYALYYDGSGCGCIQPCFPL